MLTTIDLASLGSGGITIYGIDSQDRCGYSVSNIGDINGDGFDDLAIGARTSSGENNTQAEAGEVYVVFGGASLPGTIDLANLGSDGITLFGIDPLDGAGGSVSSAGDFNGDGFADLLIGAAGGDGQGNPTTNSGESYVIFGAAALPTTLNLANLGSAGVTIFDALGDEFSGDSVSSAGDVNGDGFDDLLIGAPDGDEPNIPIANGGKNYLVFGGATPPATIELTTLGAAGVTIYGADDFDESGYSVSNAGDVNGDGFDDLLIGAKRAAGAGNAKTDAGESYLVFGGPAMPETILLGNLGSAGVTFFGADAGDRSGCSVSNAGDINGDGFDDLIIGAYFADGPTNTDPNSGESYVVFGGPSLPATIDLAVLGSAGITIFGAASHNYDGQVVSSAGDVNGDGYDDLLIGEPRGDGPNVGDAAGRSYLIFGGAALPVVINLANPNTPSITLIGVDASDESGRAISSAGDVNGDGFADLLIGARYGNGPTNTGSSVGESYVIFGGNTFTNSVTLLGTAAGETLTGDATANVIDGAAGNDTLIGNGGADVIHGGNGNDVLAISDLTFRRLNGGNGSDTLRFDGHGLALNLTALPDNKITNLEAIDVRGNGANSLTLSLRDVLQITGDSNPAHTVHTLTVRRDIDDAVNIGSGWTLVGAETINAEQYAVYTQGIATLKVSNQSPQFTSNASISVAENQTAVTTVVATDADLPAQTVSYSISGGADQAQFSISNSGALTFMTAPNFETPTDSGANNVYDVQVTANDGNGGLTVQNITVTVTNVNDAPVFTSAAAFNVPENTTTAGALTATDQDLPAQTVSFSISGGADQAKFSITSSGLTFISPPDFETPADSDTDNVYHVDVTADDGKGGLTIQNIAVTVTPVNDNLPVFSSSTTFNVAENTTAVGTTVAADADRPTQTITYSLSGGADKSLFSITGAGGLTFIAPPNFETPSDSGSNNVYDIEVTADDGQGGTTKQIIAVTVTNVNEPPVFSSSTTFNVAENSTDVGKTVATDEDAGQTVSYSLSGGSDQGKFSITSVGELTFITSPNFEIPTDSDLDNVYNVQVMASDGNGGTTLQDIAVTVTALNDNSPLFTSSATFNVAENTTAVGTTVATDADLPAQTVTCALSGGADQAKFSITGAGVLKFLTAPDFEFPTDSDTNNVYIVQVTASDGSGGSTIQNIAVTVTPVNETAPVFSSPTFFNVNENLTAVGTTVATDADLPAQAITYSLSGGVDQGKFSITSAGALTFITAPDFEHPTDTGTDNVYNVTVTANDGNGKSTSQNIAVIVFGVNDNVPVFTSPATFNVPENSTAVGNTTATDADLIVQPVSYALSGGADQAKFLVTNSGILTFATAPDFENPTDADANNVYAVQVTANDGHGGLTVQNITVTVTDVDEAPKLILGGPAVTWIKKQPPVTVLPLITVGGGANLTGGTLTISVNAIGTPKKLLDQFHFPATGGLGSTTGPQRGNGQLTLEIELNQSATNSAIQSFLRGITFATKGKGLKTLTRTLVATLAVNGEPSTSAQQTIHVQKKA
ncbi:MAG: hypothetical protein JWN70_4628 [Planctomycetaceae bacterium]|nr:hypothetical protein [Planctomycetaceae bacterium]